MTNATTGRKSDFFGARLRTSLASYTPRVAGVSHIRLFVESGFAALGAFLVLLPYTNQPTFLDEFDNMVGGNVVYHGGAIYVDYFSQHMPVAYWFSALGHFIGATSFESQRIFGFGIFALLLGCFYLRNAKVFGRVPVLMAVLAVPAMHFGNPDLSYAILSDNYQAIAGLFILFEVIRIGLIPLETKASWFLIGAFGALSVGVSFVSIYFVAASVIVSLVLDVLNFSRRHGLAGRWAREIGTRILLLAVPYVLLVVAIAATSGLPNAYEQAFLLNTTVYSKYLGGFGSNALSPVFDSFPSIWAQIVNAPMNLIVGPSLHSARVFFSLAGLLLAVIILLPIRVTLAIGLFIMGGLSAMRGWSGFHAQPIWVFLIGCVTILLWIALASGWSRRGYVMIRVPLVVAILLVTLVSLFGPYVEKLYQIGDDVTMPVAFPNPNRTKVIETLVPEGGAYADLGINNVYDFVITRRTPAGGFSGVVPWFGDLLDDKMTTQLKLDDPLLVFFDPSSEVWGVNVASHAPHLVNYIEANYSLVNLESIGVSEGAYIRNDLVGPSVDMLNKAFPQQSFSLVH